LVVGFGADGERQVLLELLRGIEILVGDCLLVDDDGCDP
jgi:hypothetical protein